MTKKKKKPVIKRDSRLGKIGILVAIGLAFGMILASSGFAFAATKESKDPFCASCHTQPESTFYQRSLAAPVDLASAHTPDKTRCIDCHSGEGVLGRMQAELLGAHNALAFYTKTAVQPAILTQPVGDANCLKCHQKVFAQRDMNNHFHVFLPRWQALDAHAATCTSCHQGHATDGDKTIKYLNRTTTQAVCQDCHNHLAEGG